MKILYLDRNIVAAEKPVGVLSESSDIDADRGMPELLSEHMQNSGEKNTGIFPVHRLDRNVGGVIIFARNKKAAAALSGQIADKDKKNKKTYFAVISGEPENLRGEMLDRLYHDTKTNKTFVVDSARKGSKEARLEYETVKCCTSGENKLSLVKITLDTGRSHQIRVQFASRGMPIVGDGKYGSRIKNKNIALWSYGFEFYDMSGTRRSVKSDYPDEYPWNIF